MDAVQIIPVIVVIAVFLYIVWHGKADYIRNHDHISFDEIRRCRAVRDISRYTPADSGEEEPLEDLLARADEVADGMKVVMNSKD
jgi:hypothetical protein